MSAGTAGFAKAGEVYQKVRTLRSSRRVSLDPEPERSEFAEIALAKSKIKLLRDAEGAIALQVTSVGGASLLQIGVSLDGARLEYWPLRGMNMNPAPEPPMVPVILVSDREQLFGRACPKCKAYFRTADIAEVICCPYCSIRAPLIQFTTQNQLRFIDEVRRKYVEGLRGDKLEEIDLDAIAQALPDNRPSWAYSEELQQHRFDCEKCGNRFDILGEYGCCPVCGSTRRHYRDHGCRSCLCRRAHASGETESQRSARNPASRAGGAQGQILHGTHCPGRHTWHDGEGKSDLGQCP